MVFNSAEQEPPIRRPFISVQFIASRGLRLLEHLARRQWLLTATAAVSSRSLVYILPVALVAVTVGTSVVYGGSYAADISDLVALEPKTKMGALSAIDQFSPFIQESRDSEPIVTAELTPAELIMKKPSLTSVERGESSEEVPAAPAARTEVITHTVEMGETLSEIAALYDLSIGSLQVENKSVTRIDDLQPGDQLRIPPREYDSTYIATVLKQRGKTQLAKNQDKERQVVVRGTSAARYGDGGEPAFRRPAGSLGQNGYHSWAVDISPAGGSGVYASANGVVTEVASGWNGGYGNMIVIDHGSGWQTLYAHLSEINTAPGQTVGAGEYIGVMGATGRTFPKGAVHLHFEISKGGVRLNPLNYLQ